MFGYPIQCDIAVILPIFDVERNKGEHIYGSLKYVKYAALSVPVETVLRVAAFHISLIGFSLCIGASLMSVTGDAVFVKPYKHSVVVFVVLIDQFLMGKVRQYLAVYKTLLDKVRKHPAHVWTGLREFEIFFRRRHAL